jgi:hypothetical protein
MSTTTGSTPSPLSGTLLEAPAVQESAYSPAYMTATMVASDFGMLATSVGAGFALWRLFNPAIPPLQPEMLLLPLCCVGVFGSNGQYPGIGLSAVEHLRRICRGVSSVYLLFLFAMFLTKGTWSACFGDRRQEDGSSHSPQSEGQPRAGVPAHRILG